jgi:hypothetical protein
MVRAGTSVYGLGLDLTVLVVAVTVLVAIAARMLPRIIT